MEKKKGNIDISGNNKEVLLGGVTEPKDWLRPARNSTPSLCLFVFLPRRRRRETLIFQVIIKKSYLVMLRSPKIGFALHATQHLPFGYSTNTIRILLPRRRRR